MASSKATQALSILQYWHEREPPGYIADLLQSFRTCNPGVRHLVFSESSAAELIERHFGERELAAFKACAVPAMQADYFRYCAISALGGIYVDADFGCRSPLSSLADGRCARLFELSHGGIINGLFAFPSPGHPALGLAREIATVNIENRVTQSVWGTTGPAIFSGMLKLYRHGSIDAFLRFAREQRPEIDRLGRKLWDPEIFCAVVGNYDRLASALEGIELVPFAAWQSLIETDPHTPYKQSDFHYGRWTGSIYR